MALSDYALPRRGESANGTGRTEGAVDPQW